jgi:hypothetical protein
MEVQSEEWKVQYDECGIVGCGTVGMENEKRSKRDSHIHIDEIS